MTNIHTHRHHAMATHYEVRIAAQPRDYAAQAAQAAFDLLDTLESHLTRFRPASPIARLAHLTPGETMRLPEHTFDCLTIAHTMQLATRNAFSITASALQAQPAPPQWTLLPRESAILCQSGRLTFDLGAIGKGFALDRIAALLHTWQIDSYLLIAGGSSILAGAPPPTLEGWSCGLGESHTTHRILLTNASLSGSGLAVQGAHILDPRTGQPIPAHQRTWAIADTAAESDALSTAAMVLTQEELTEILSTHPQWLVYLENQAHPIGHRPHPPTAPASTEPASPA